MPELLRGWSIGPGRACKHSSLPLPGHRDMGEVLAQEQREAVERGATAFARARKHEEQHDGEYPPRL